MITLVQISWRMWQWKNFENRPVFDEVRLCVDYVGLLFWPTLYFPDFSANGLSSVPLPLVSPKIINVYCMDSILQRLREVCAATAVCLLWTHTMTDYVIPCDLINLNLWHFNLPPAASTSVVTGQQAITRPNSAILCFPLNYGPRRSRCHARTQPAFDCDISNSKVYARRQRKCNAVPRSGNNA